MKWRPAYELLRLVAGALLVWIIISIAFHLLEDEIWALLRRMAEAKGLVE